METYKTLLPFEATAFHPITWVTILPGAEITIKKQRMTDYGILTVFSFNGREWHTWT